MKTCLVAGGAGFIGSHLCQALLRRGFRVTAVDSLISGRRRNLAGILGCSRFRFLKRDILHPLHLPADYIFNLASPASPSHYQKHPIYTLRSGAEGTRNLLELARRRRARLLHASTSEVYGDPQVHPQPETYWGHVNPIGARACYDEAKRYAEALCLEYWRQEKVDVRIVRIFNTYGPRLDPNDGRVISNHLRQALRGQAITVYGDGSQTRSFQYIDDLIQAMLKVVFLPRARPGCVYNAGNPVEITVLQAARLIKKLSGSSSPIVFMPLPKDDPARRRPDIRKLRKELGWSPKVPLAEGLKRTLAWYRRHEI